MHEVIFALKYCCGDCGIMFYLFLYVLVYVHIFLTSVWRRRHSDIMFRINTAHDFASCIFAFS